MLIIHDNNTEFSNTDKKKKKKKLFFQTKSVFLLKAFADDGKEDKVMTYYTPLLKSF